MRRMQVGQHVLGMVVAAGLAACFPTPSQDYACDTNADCDPGRVCGPTKYCVIASSNEPDAPAGSDAGPIDGAVIDADPFAATRTACMAAGYTMEPTTGGLYRPVTTAASWNTATTDCANDVPGATHLIVLSTVLEVNYQKTQLDSWVGWTDEATENNWVNLTNETTVINTADYWAPGRPDGGNDENCADFKTTAGIDDVDCPQAHRYICECDGRAPI